jgi:hypothetical protein
VTNWTHEELTRICEAEDCALRRDAETVRFAHL